jgi:carbon storage regulator CsrA
MLVLTRKINEAIMIGDDIEIAVVDIKGDQVKLGIRAPRSVKVFRHEVYDAHPGREPPGGPIRRGTAVPWRLPAGRGERSRSR